MTTTSQTHRTPDTARRAVSDPRAARVPESDIQRVARRDMRFEPAGGFAGPVGPDAPVGTFAGRPLRRWQGAGSFAGDPDRRRQGSFADVDRGVIVRYEDGAERPRMIRAAQLRAHLRPAA